MSLRKPNATQGSYRSPKSPTPFDVAKPQKSVVFQDNSTLNESASTAFDRQNFANSPSLFENPNRTAYSLFNSPKRNSVSFHGTQHSIVKSVILRTNNGNVDEDYPESVDKLLEDGFSVVSERKDKKQSFISQRNALEARISQANRDLLPEQRRGKLLKETLQEARGMRAKYMDDIHHVEAQIMKLKDLIVMRKEENKKSESELELTIEKLHGEIHEVSGDIVARRDAQQQAIVKLEQKLVTAKDQQRGLNGEIGDLKSQLGYLKAQSVARTNMLENKATTYVGMLQHRGI